MKVFKNAWFSRFARKEKITASVLWDAIDRAEKGQIDADLGGGVIKQRIARPGEGKSKGYRSIILFRKDDKVFLFTVFLKANSAISALMKKISSRKWPSMCWP